MNETEGKAAQEREAWQELFESVWYGERKSLSVEIEPGDGVVKVTFHTPWEGKNGEGNAKVNPRGALTRWSEAVSQAWNGGHQANVDHWGWEDPEKQSRVVNLATETPQGRAESLRESLQAAAGWAGEHVRISGEKARLLAPWPYVDAAEWIEGALVTVVTGKKGDMDTLVDGRPERQGWPGIEGLNGVSMTPWVVATKEAWYSRWCGSQARKAKRREQVEGVVLRAAVQAKDRGVALLPTTAEREKMREAARKMGMYWEDYAALRRWKNERTEEFGVEPLGPWTGAAGDPLCPVLVIEPWRHGDPGNPALRHFGWLAEYHRPWMGWQLLLGEEKLEGTPWYDTLAKLLEVKVLWKTEGDRWVNYTGAPGSAPPRRTEVSEARVVIQVKGGRSEASPARGRHEAQLPALAVRPRWGDTWWLAPGAKGDPQDGGRAMLVSRGATLLRAVAGRAVTEVQAQAEAAMTLEPVMYNHAERIADEFAGGEAVHLREDRMKADVSVHHDEDGTYVQVTVEDETGRRTQIERRMGSSGEETGQEGRS